MNPDTASTFADRLETLLNDTIADRVDLQAVNDSGDPVASRYSGTCRLSDESRLRQLALGRDVWRYNRRSTEAD